MHSASSSRVSLDDLNAAYLFEKWQIWFEKFQLDGKIVYLSVYLSCCQELLPTDIQLYHDSCRLLLLYVCSTSFSNYENVRRLAYHRVAPATGRSDSDAWVAM